MRRINAVTFDWWQTLIIDEREQGRARARVRILGAQKVLWEQMGMDLSEDYIREAYRQCYRTCRATREEDKDVSFMEQVGFFIRYIDEGLPERLSDETFNSIATYYADAFYEFPPEVHPQAQRVLQETKDNGYKLGLISNTGMTPGVTFRVYLSQHGLLDYFDALTFSDEVRLAKPSGEIFQLTVDALEADASATAHVGDHLLNDVIGAQRVGMKTVWISGFDDSGTHAKPDVVISNLSDVGRALSHLS